ncbi:arsenate reductase ArsC [Acinetobacter stercoris]|uniref:Arsenate-mycothiol transferase ArsC1 n=1 Tax=Acinetobacter stercoris TaxID=2126983 RepID=A0A2U3MWR6_9GAMM|nr:arsenate reductase ArsC [Acinetobacter stercoris]SPL69878.1 Arsenate-mycothiol transferase ArsC1 [Acinetobacter stercoris]
MKILFLCTGNSCRSILSEVLFNNRAPAGWKAFSAGSKPSGIVHPFTLKTLENLGLSTEGLFSKHIDDCEQYQPDVVITVCDQAAQEACPLYLGAAIKAHWGLSDPSHLNLPEIEKLQEFQKTIDHINRRLDVLFSLDVKQLPRAELIAEINKISNIG